MARMDPRKKSGIKMIVVGILVPLLALPFVSGYSKERSFFDNFYKIGIQIRKDKEGNAGNEPFADLGGQKGKMDYTKLIPKRIPLRFFLVITLVLFYVGIVRIAVPRPKEEDTESQEHS